jgi:hypothetical protein
MKKKAEKPQAKEVSLKEDRVAAACQGKKLGCYAGSTCNSVKKEVEKEKN